jgi:hypothetical protein
MSSILIINLYESELVIMLPLKVCKKQGRYNIYWICSQFWWCLKEKMRLQKVRNYLNLLCLLRIIWRCFCRSMERIMWLDFRTRMKIRRLPLIWRNLTSKWLPWLVRNRLNRVRKIDCTGRIRELRGIPRY